MNPDSFQPADESSAYPDEMPARARRAFDAYPQIAAPADFNRRVLLALEARQAAQNLTLLGRIEAFLGLPLGQFLGSGALGAFFPALILSVLCFSNRPAPTPQPALPDFVLLRPYNPFDTRQRFALNPEIG